MIFTCNEKVLEKRKQEKGVKSNKKLAELFPKIKVYFLDSKDGAVSVSVEGPIKAMEEFMLFVEGNRVHQENTVNVF